MCSAFNVLLCSYSCTLGNTYTHHHHHQATHAILVHRTRVIVIIDRRKRRFYTRSGGRRSRGVEKKTVVRSVYIYPYSHDSS